MQKKWFLYGLAALMAVAVACGGNSKTSPVSPSAATDSTTDAAADGSTWKISAPAPSLPTTASTVDSLTPNLVITNATSKFVAQTIATYRFVVLSAAGATVYDSGLVGSGASLTGHRVAADKLKAETTYTWKARGESNSTTYGPWSTAFTFTTPKGLTDGFQTATTLWDPLTNGKTIGTATGMEFTKDVGARTVSNESTIRYDLLQTLNAGEYSFFVYNLNPLSAGDKTKLMSMQEGTDDITTNDYRFTVEKRGVSYTVPGQVRIRIIAGDSSEEAHRIFDSAPTVPALVKNVWYFVRLTWGSGRARLRIFNADGTTGTLGSSVLDVDMGYGSFVYKPVPHTAWVGAPVGRAGPSDASVSNMTVKWVWIGGAGTTRPDGK